MSFPRNSIFRFLSISTVLLSVLFFHSVRVFGQEAPTIEKSQDAPRPSPLNGLPPDRKPAEPSQSDLREKFKNQIGGFAFDRYYSVQVARMLDSQWAIGFNAYSNTYVNRFDNDVGYALYPSQNVFGRLRNIEDKYRGGAFFVQRYLLDSPFFFSLWLGRENYLRNESNFYWEAAGKTYRFEKDSFSSGPRNFAGIGTGFRFQTQSGFFFGWEAVYNWYFPYKSSFSVSDLYYSDRVASTGDLLYRKYAYQNSERLPSTSFGLNLFVGLAF
ncbi:hypothetical protein EHQ53_08225 [Leptospira langatensis]|uniref:DUF3575 domain-containing protein n=1 Tax=Leptospira langatensis TaxID=2484983 RepID=A0A5F1ZWY9_9LEPT|nr:hypothetical protein [Leptospira langatensis]TGK01378.1 hypothetical protein EHO57_10645 [Leptospira langatensis]TGL42171.1 hypothetical protein EHQ53_08225 [Leptospira langatensis]